MTPTLSSIKSVACKYIIGSIELVNRNSYFCYFSFRVGADWSEICEQPELRLSSTLEFDPEKTETVTLPLTQPTPKIIQLSESDSTRQDTKKFESTSKTTENTLDVKELKELTTESNDDKQESPCTNEQPTSSSAAKPEDANDNKSKKVFVFSVDNIPSGSYYLTHPNKYVFPGSTHKWYGSGTDKDREEIFEAEDDDDEFEIGFDDDDDDDEENDEDVEEDCYDDKCETESSTNHDHNSDSDNADALKANDSIVLGKRLGPAENETESVSPVKQQKTEDE